VRQLAGLLGSIRPQGSLAICMGGEEFLLLFPSTPAGDAFADAERLRLRVQDHDCSEIDPKLEVTCSVGLADWSLTDRLEAALHIADASLYAAKNAGRNRCMATAA